MTYEELVSAVREVRELLYSHRHLGNDLTSKLRATTVSQLTVVNSSLLGDGVGQSGTLTMSLAPNQGDVYIRAVIDAGDFANTGAKTGFIIGLDDSDSDLAKFYFGSPSNYIKYDGSTLTVAGALTASSINIPDTTTANSFHVDTSGNAWWGSNVAGGLATATAKILNTGAATFTNVTITGGAISVGALNLANRGWTQTCAFSVTDADTVAWGAGSFVAADGTTYSIDAGNTGNMVAKTFIYLDAGVSTTVYQTTTTAATAVGAGKVLIAVAQNATGEATYEVMAGQGGKNIDASSIVANSITANELSTSITYAGQIIVSTAGAIRSGQTDYNTGTGWWLGNSGGTPKFSIGVDTGSRITWDGSTLSIVGNASNSKLYTYGETISVGDAVCPQSYPAADVTYDNSADHRDNTASTTRTFSFTVGNNSNRIMVIFFAITDNNTTYTVSNVTYNGDAVTSLGSVGDGVGGRCYRMYLVAPDVGTANVSYDVNSAAGVGVSAAVYSFYNAVQTAPADEILADYVTGSGNTGAFTPSLNGSMALACICGGGLTSIDSGLPATNQETNTGLGAGHTAALYPIVEQTAVAYTYSGSSTIARFILSIQPHQTSATVRVYKTKATILNRTKPFFGFAAEAGTVGQSKAVVLSGIASGLTSIGIGSQYYLSDTAGALSTSAGTNTRKAAVGVSTTEVLITNIW